MEPTHGYKLHLHELGLYPDHNPARVVFIATRPEPSFPEPYRLKAHVLFKANLKSMPSHGPQDLAIELINSKQLPWHPIYNLSKKKLNTLCSYLKVQLKRG
jgi:hypothetical protein